MAHWHLPDLQGDLHPPRLPLLSQGPQKMEHFLGKAQARSVTAEGKLHSWDWQEESFQHSFFPLPNAHLGFTTYWQSFTVKRLFPLQRWHLTGTATKRGGGTWAVSFGQDPQTGAGQSKPTTDLPAGSTSV